MAVLKISLPVLLLDEILKFIARNYIDGTCLDEHGQTQPIGKSRAAKVRAALGLVAMAAITFAYFAYILGPYADEIQRSMVGPVVDPNVLSAAAESRSEL